MWGGPAVIQDFGSGRVSTGPLLEELFRSVKADLFVLSWVVTVVVDSVVHGVHQQANGGECFQAVDVRVAECECVDLRERVVWQVEDT